MNIKSFLSVIIFSVLMVVIYSCSKSSSNPSQQPGGNNGSNGSITITGMAFPASTTVAKGTTVSWYNGDGYAHTVTSDDGTTFNSGNLAAGATFTYKAATAGSFSYHCNYHSNMKGTLIVSP
jgi:plastocyanin